MAGLKIEKMGDVANELNEQLDIIQKDCLERPDILGKRTVTLKVILEIKEDKSGFKHTVFDREAKHSLPGKKGVPLPVRVSGDEITIRMDSSPTLFDEHES